MPERAKLFLIIWQVDPPLHVVTLPRHFSIEVSPPLTHMSISSGSLFRIIAPPGEAPLKLAAICSYNLLPSNVVFLAKTPMIASPAAALTGSTTSLLFWGFVAIATISKAATSILVNAFIVFCFCLKVIYSLKSGYLYVKFSQIPLMPNKFSQIKLLPNKFT